MYTSQIVMRLFSRLHTASACCIQNFTGAWVWLDNVYRVDCHLQLLVLLHELQQLYVAVL